MRKSIFLIAAVAMLVTSCGGSADVGKAPANTLAVSSDSTFFNPLFPDHGAHP